MTTSSNNLIFISYQGGEPCSVTVATQCQITYLDDEEKEWEDFLINGAAELAKSLDEAERGVTLPLWFVLNAPAWLVRLAFWIKERLRHA